MRRVQRVVANTVVGQMIPSGVVKGGTGIKLRVGEWLSRFTPDFDLSRPAAVDVGSYIEGLQEALGGWCQTGDSRETRKLPPHRISRTPRSPSRMTQMTPFQ
jgi:hypothetical protein